MAMTEDSDDGNAESTICDNITLLHNCLVTQSPSGCLVQCGNDVCNAGLEGAYGFALGSVEGGGD